MRAGADEGRGAVAAVEERAEEDDDDDDDDEVGGNSESESNGGRIRVGMSFGGNDSSKVGFINDLHA